MTKENPVETTRSTSPAIQPRGWVLVCDEPAARVLDHSANLARLFPARAEGFIGLALRDLLGSATAHALRNGLARAGKARVRLCCRASPSRALPAFTISRSILHGIGRSSKSRPRAKPILSRSTAFAP